MHERSRGIEVLEKGGFPFGSGTVMGYFAVTQMRALTSGITRTSPPANALLTSFAV
jgi:hypothetical protein